MTAAVDEGNGQPQMGYDKAPRGYVRHSFATLANRLSQDSSSATMSCAGARVGSLAHVEQRLHRVREIFALLSGIHACHSLGMISGSLLGAAAEHIRLSIAVHFGLSSVIAAVVAVVGTRSLLPSSTDAVPSSALDDRATIAAVGFGIFATSMFLGRLVGDRLVERFGPVRPFPIGTLVAGLGLGTALLIGGTPAGLVGLALFRVWHLIYTAVDLRR
jgi:hypothetical protein